MNFTGAVFICSMVAACVFLVSYVRVNLSLTSVSLVFLLLFHGTAYWYYTRHWGLGDGYIYHFYAEAWPRQQRFFEQILATASGQPVIALLDLALAISFVGFCMGVVVVDRLFSQHRDTHVEGLRRWKARNAESAQSAATGRIVFLSLAGIFLMLYFAVSDQQLQKIYWYFGTTAGEVKKISMRREMGGSHSYLFNLALSTVLPFLSFCLWSLWREHAKGIVWLLIVFLALIIVAKLSMLSKAPAVIFILQMLVMEYARKSLNFSIGAVATIVAGSVVLFSLMTFAANSDLENVSQSLVFLFYRVFMIPNESLLEYFAAIPYKMPHTWGLDIRWFAGLLQTEALQPNYWRVAEIHRGVGGSATTAMFVGDAWAAFSWAGVVVAPFGFGALVRWLDTQIIILRPKTATTIAGLMLGHYGIFIAMSTALQTSLVTGGFLMILPLIVAIEGWDGPFKLKT